MKRIGILGGTFNPVHIGHLMIAQRAYEALKLEKVLFVPSYLPPHKSFRDVASARDRYSMVQASIRGTKHFELIDFEIQRKQKSYSIDTVRYLKQCHDKGTHFYFIIGKDSLNKLHTWKYVDELLKQVTFVCFLRPGYNSARPRIKVRLIKSIELHIASSDIRSMVRKNQSIRYLVPEAVRRYIHRKKLYRK